MKDHSFTLTVFENALAYFYLHNSNNIQDAYDLSSLSPREKSAIASYPDVWHVCTICVTCSLDGESVDALIDELLKVLHLHIPENCGHDAVMGIVQTVYNVLDDDIQGA